MRVKDIDKVFFRGIVKREFYNSLHGILSADFITVKRNRIPCILNFISSTDPLNPIVKKRFLLYSRELLLAATRNPKLLFSRSWVPFTLTACFPMYGPTDLNLRPEPAEGAKARVFSSREVARFGFPTNSLAPTLEYELKRSWDSYDALFVSASVKFHKIKGKLPFSSTSNPPKIRIKIKSMERLLSNTYFRELLEIEIPSENMTQKEYRGTAVAPISWQDSASHHSLWVHRIVNQAEILHGNVVYSRSQFFFPDGMRTPTYGSVGNLWPGYMYQDSQQVIHSPACRSQKSSIHEAIYIGGTKNWMHFVIEDLPRIIKFDLMKIPISAPIIISEDLGRQIIQSIRELTSRDLIIAKPFEVIPVTKLHFLEFANPLMATMSGDEEAASQLFDSRILDFARQKFSQVDVKPLAISNKVLVRREKNLFRPLINADKLQRILEEKYGFHTMYLGDKSLIEVMATFVNASVVVGEYGAGLANMIFIRNKSLIVEIRGGFEKSADEYRALGEALGHEYEVAHGVNRKFTKFGVARGPYKIDIDKVTQILDSHLLAMQDYGSS
jgi:capsular polysaccharide biosynthesis protein